MEVKTENIKQELYEYIRENFHIKDDDNKFTYDVNLFEEGYIDSMGLVSYIAYLEEKYYIEIGEKYLYDERFLNIEGQSEIILEILN
ncbi:MAG: hypothetical protein JXB88_15360 [Spirochaetales bacterium]|nr:hypothetical protein [Spirochaetales bacterium]